MQILEQLYHCVETHLAHGQPRWPGFCSQFRLLFRADVVLYRVKHDPDGRPSNDMEFIATSNVPVMSAYFERRIFEHHPISEADLAPLEPVRRSDLMTDDELLQHGALSEFLIKYDIFYQIVVPALMRDGTYLGLYLWRTRRESDFSDLEKQRLALLMRYLLAVVSDDYLVWGPARPDVVAFGRKFDLTQAEIEILDALLEGLSPKQIARDTARSYGTVRWHIQKILEKCQVSSQRGLLSEFYRLVKH
jgi:DNA-binding CsgD family transcriptional regulator